MTSKLKVNLINDSGDNNLITSDGSGSVTLGTAFPAVGKIGQVLSVAGSGSLTTTSTSYSDILSLAITPSSTSSKILIIHGAPSNVELSNSSNLGHIAIFRDSTNITTAGHNSSYASYQTLSRGYGTSITFLDSPSTTSATTYKIRGKTDNTGLTFYYNSSGQPRMLTLTLMEILP
tara:strand:+ start:31 stop:558 length:528 start_codon:yes stop_codon:yes gene_type:complete